MKAEIYKILIEDNIGIGKARRLTEKLLNLYNVVRRYKLEAEYKDLEGEWIEATFETYAEDDKQAIDELVEKYPTARGIFITRY